MAPAVPVTLSDSEGQFSSVNCSHTSGNVAHVNSDTFTHELESGHGTKFQLSYRNRRTSKLRRSQTHCESDNISERKRWKTET